MTARAIEAQLLTRCAAVARSPAALAQDQREANVFRLAAMVIQSRCPAEARRLMYASEAYFSRFPADRLAAEDVVKNGWVFSLPRLRDMLSLKFTRP